MDPISLKTTSRVKPTILNGRESSQISGNKKTKTRAKGQEMANSINQSIRAIKTFMQKTLCLTLAKEEPVLNSLIEQ